MFNDYIWNWGSCIISKEPCIILNPSSGLIVCSNQHHLSPNISRRKSLHNEFCLGMYGRSIVPRLFPPPVFDHLQNGNTEG